MLIQPASPTNAGIFNSISHFKSIKIIAPLADSSLEIIKRLKKFNSSAYSPSVYA